MHGNMVMATFCLFSTKVWTFIFGSICGCRDSRTGIYHIYCLIRHNHKGHFRRWHSCYVSGIWKFGTGIYEAYISGICYKVCSVMCIVWSKIQSLIALLSCLSLRKCVYTTTIATGGGIMSTNHRHSLIIMLLQTQPIKTFTCFAVGACSLQLQEN